MQYFERKGSVSFVLCLTSAAPDQDVIHGEIWSGPLKRRPNIKRSPPQKGTGGP